MKLPKIEEKTYVYKNKVYKRRKLYLFKVSFGRLETGGEFDPEISSINVRAWDAVSAIRKAKNNVEMGNKEIISSVEFLGFNHI